MMDKMMEFQLMKACFRNHHNKKDLVSLMLQLLNNFNKPLLPLVLIQKKPTDLHYCYITTTISHKNQKIHLLFIRLMVMVTAASELSPIFLLEHKNIIGNFD